MKSGQESRNDTDEISEALHRPDIRLISPELLFVDTGSACPFQWTRRQQDFTAMGADAKLICRKIREMTDSRSDCWCGR